MKIELSKLVQASLVATAVTFAGNVALTNTAFANGNATQSAEEKAAAEAAAKAKAEQEAQEKASAKAAIIGVPTLRQLAAVEGLIAKRKALEEAKAGKTADSDPVDPAVTAYNDFNDKIVGNDEVNKLVTYVSLLTESELAAYKKEVSSISDADFKSELTFGSGDTAVKVSGDKLYKLRVKRAAFDEAKEEQQDAQSALQTQIAKTLEAFNKVVAAIPAEATPTETSVVNTETATTFKTAVSELQTEFATLTEADLFAEAVNNNSSTVATTLALYKKVAEATTAAATGVRLASGEATTATDNIAKAVAIIDTITEAYKDQDDKKATVATLTELKEQLTTLKTALAEAATNTAETTKAATDAKTAFVAYAKEIGLANADAEADTVVTNLYSVVGKEASGTTLIAAIAAQVAAETSYNQAATSQVLASAIAESQLAQGRYLLQSVRGQAQGAFANVFYNSKDLSVLDVTYPTLVLGGDYQIVPSTKAGAALTVSTAELELARANTYLQDIAYGFNVFVDYSENDIFATGLVGYTKHDVFGTFLGSKYDQQYNSFDFAARVGYDFDFAESGKASVAGVYQFNSLGFTKLKTHVFGVEADYKYKLDNTFELTAGLGVYFQSHNKAKVAVPSYVQVVNSTLVDFGKNTYKKSGAVVAVNLGLTSYIAKNSVLSTEFGYQRDPRGSSNYNVNVGYRFKFN